MHLLLCGYGYLGHAIAREFLHAGWSVTAVSRGDAAGDAIQALGHPQLQHLHCDLSSREQVLSLSLLRPDMIVHCAASGKGGTDAYRAVYLDGCRHLLDTFPGTPLLFTSSTSVYAQTDGAEVTEDSPAEPDRETGKILLETERLVLAHGGIVTRLAGIYGPQRSVILQKFLSGEAVIEEDGRRFLNQIHRDDAARAIFHLLASSQLSSLNSPPFVASAKKGQLFNLCDSSPLTQLACYQGLAALFQKPLPPSGPRDLNRKRGWTHKRVSNAKLRATGWQPHFPGFLDAATQIAPTL